MTVEPAFPVPPHVLHGSEGEIQVWFTEPAGAIVQLAKPQRATLEQSQWLVGPGIERLREEFPNGEKLILVLDYRNMTSRDTSARTLMMDRAGDISHMFEHVVIVPPLNASAVYRATLQAAVALVSIWGVHIELVPSLEVAISRYSLSASDKSPGLEAAKRRSKRPM
jgi:hypothetical protein